MLPRPDYQSLIGLGRITYESVARPLRGFLYGFPVALITLIFAGQPSRCRKTVSRHRATSD